MRSFALKISSRCSIKVECVQGFLAHSGIKRDFLLDSRRFPLLISSLLSNEPSILMGHTGSLMVEIVSNILGMEEKPDELSLLNMEILSNFLLEYSMQKLEISMASLYLNRASIQKLVQRFVPRQHTSLEKNLA